MTDYTNGNWHAATLGEFVALLIDSGNDPVVVFRFEDGPEVNGVFPRFIMANLIPDGMVKAAIETMRPESVHKTLAVLIQAGVVK